MPQDQEYKSMYEKAPVKEASQDMVKAMFTPGGLLKKVRDTETKVQIPPNTSTTVESTPSSSSQDGELSIE